MKRFSNFLVGFEILLEIAYFCWFWKRLRSKFSYKKSWVGFVLKLSFYNFMAYWNNFYCNAKIRLVHFFLIQALLQTQINVRWNSSECGKYRRCQTPLLKLNFSVNNQYFFPQNMSLSQVGHISNGNNRLSFRL